MSTGGLLIAGKPIAISRQAIFRLDVLPDYPWHLYKGYSPRGGENRTR